MASEKIKIFSLVKLFEVLYYKENQNSKWKNIWIHIIYYKMEDIILNFYSDKDDLVDKQKFYSLSRVTLTGGSQYLGGQGIGFSTEMKKKRE